MTEEPGQAAAVTETTVETTGTETTTEAPSIVGEDGITFSENWRDSLDEDIRDDASLATIKDIKSLSKSFVHARKMVGKDKISIPNEATTVEEWDEFYKAGGKPENANDYNFARPEDMPEELYNEELASSAQELFHKIGLSRKQADALFKFNNDNATASFQNLKNTEETTMQELKDGLYHDWGNAYEQKKHLGNLAVEKGTEGNSELKDRLVAKLGNDPDFIRFSANIGAKFGESGVITTTHIPTPGDIQEQIDEITMSKVYGPDYVKHGFTRVQHDAAVNKALRLREQIMENVKTG